MSVQLQFCWNQFLLIFIFNEGHCFPGRLEQVFLDYLCFVLPQHGVTRRAVVVK